MASTHDQTSPKYTPALTTSSHDTPSVVAQDDPFLSTPTRSENNTSLNSFLFPSRSFEIEQFTNIKDVVPEWEDDEVDEIMVLSPKSKMKASLSVVEEAEESCVSIPSLSSFDPVRAISTSTDSPRVWLGKHAESERLYAIKTYAKSTISYDTPVLEQAMKEQMMLRLLTQMNVQFVARLRWSFQDQEALHIVMDYCPDADLTNYVKHTGPLLTSDVCIYAAELAEALCSLHGSGITHRSLRPEHILLHTSGHILLTGFSKSSFSSPNTPSNGYFPQSSSRSRQTTGWPCAMDEWNAPETILGWPEDCAIDIWAFGLVLWFMLTGKHPLDTGLSNESNLELHPEILLSLILHAPFRFEGHNVQADIRNLVARCIQRNARLRANAEDIKAHAYFADINWPRLRQKQYTLNFKPKRTFEAVSVSADDLAELAESETLRGVHIAGFNFTPDESLQDQSNFDISGYGIKTKDSLHSPEEEACPSVASEESVIPPTLDKRTTSASARESVYVTPMGSIDSDAKSLTSSDAPSTALYSCTSLGELRECLKSTAASDGAITADDAIKFQEHDELQNNQADRPPPPRRASDPTYPVGVLGTSKQGSPSSVTRRDSAPLLTPPGILLRNDTADTELSRSASRSSALVFGSNSRPPSSLSLGGARGLRLRKYASLNFDLDTVTSLEADLEDEGMVRPRSLATSRRVSFVDTMNAESNSENTIGNVTANALPPAPFSVPIGGGHPWSFKGLNNFRITSPSGTSTANTSSKTGNSSGQSKLKKRNRTTSTPVLPTMTTTPCSPDRAELPEGLKQIGLGIGYTHTPSRERMSPLVAGDVFQALSTPTMSTPSKRAVGTTSAIQKCTSILAGLRHGKQANGKHGQGDGHGRLDALMERASEESDALEAVMREMYGASWSAEGGGGPAYGGGGGGAESVRRPGKVYSVPGMPRMTETLVRSRAGNATSSTLRLVEPAREGEL